MAPPSGDLVAPDLLNRALRDEAVQNGLPAADVARAGRSVEIAFRVPLVLSSFNPVVVDDDITVTDSRFPGETRSILNYLEQGLPGTPNAAFSFRRSSFGPRTGEGNCAFDSGDKTCDTIVLHFQDGALTDGTRLSLSVSGAGLDGYDVVDGAPTATVIELGGVSVVGFDVRVETGAAPELQSYSLRLPGDSGPDIEGEFEVGVCTTCPAPSLIFPLPQIEFYVPVRSGIRGRFNESPARIGAFIESGEELAFLGANNLTGPEGAFRPGIDTEFALGLGAAPGLKIDTFAITSDDLLTQVGSPGRFSLPPATQSASGREFVQRVGTTGNMPSSDVQHFTFSHTRIPGQFEGGLPDHKFVGIADLQGDTQVELPIDVVMDAENPARIVTELELAIRDANDPNAARQLVPSGDEFLDPERPTVTFDLLDIPEGEWAFYVRGSNSDGGSLGSDRVRITVDVTVPAILAEESLVVDNSLADGTLDRICAASTEELAGIRVSVEPPGIDFDVSLEGIAPVFGNGVFVYCIDDVPMPSGIGIDGEPYLIRISPIDRAGNDGVAAQVPTEVDANAVSTRLLTQEISGLKGTGRNYWDMTDAARGRFDALVVARALRRSQDPPLARPIESAAGVFLGDFADQEGL
jgi:hypothetical protein